MPALSWNAPPADLRLAGPTVDVWRADLTAAGAAERAPLSPQEQGRAGRFVRPRDGERWAAARGTLRLLLGRYLDADPSTLRFTLGEHGKPALAGEDDLRFNVSHSGDLALYAFARGREVGVDVELPRREIDVVGVARRALGPEEAQRLAAVADPAERERAFLRAWVRWEAILKCRGTGIGGADSAVQPSAEPYVEQLVVGGPGAAAVAVDGPPCEVRCWRWEGAGG